jgi:prepilin-type N-terminal cleavage/methylation domain-containing protein
MKKESGFTLIELLLVLAIIGIISAVAIPALLGQREKAKIRAVQGLCNAASAEIQSAVNMMTTSSVTPTASAVVAKVLTASNLAKAKNPYGGTTTYTATAGTTLGTVTLVANSTYVDPISGESHAAIVIHGNYKEGGTSKSFLKFIAVD